MSKPIGYIDLDRRFRALHGLGGVEEAAASSYLRGSFGGFALGWDELLKERLAIVLGEPGSGKSWEFRQRCALLKEAGRPAFLVELERLVSGAWAAGFSADDLKRLQQWQNGRRNGILFSGLRR